MKLVLQLTLLVYINLGISFLSQGQNSPPEIVAVGSNEYCPLTYQKILDDVTIVDADDSSTTAIYIQISSGYNKSTDMLLLQGVFPTIVSSWDINAGKLSLLGLTSGTASYTEFVNALKNVVYYNNSPNPAGNRSFSITVGAANYLPTNGHYYEFIPALGITWLEAKVAAETTYYYGLKGYLATLTSMEEAILAGKQSKGAGWIGGSDEETEGVWKWVTGPEAGIQFWQGLSTGSTTTPFSFAFWNTGEPNQYLGANEDYAHITAPNVGNEGSWNDLTITGSPSGDYQPKGYIVEYGGMPGDPVLKISTSTKITIPQIASVISKSRCGSGNLTLEASSTNNSVFWYNNATGGLPIAMGTSFTPNLNTTTTFYVSPYNETCNGTRTPVVGTIFEIPSIISVVNTSRCGNGNVTIEAMASTGIINWYDSASSSTILFTGSSFTTPQLETTTTYYVEAYNNGCSNGVRVPVTATINKPPNTYDEVVSFCENNSIILDATSLNVSYEWNTGELTPKISVNSPGEYSVTLTDLSTQCKAVKKYTVKQINKPVIKEVKIDYNTAEIFTVEQGDYEYSINSQSFQLSSEFLNLKGGLIKFIVSETNGCGIDEKDVFVLIIPRVITPNNDQFNDNFNIDGISYYPNASIQIFDRFGRIIYHQTNNKKPWDGVYNGKQLPSADYWYSIFLSEELPLIKGHFSLKRN